MSSIRSDVYRSLVDLLIAARRNAGFTQAELGRHIGQRQTFVSKYELGERRLDVAEFIEICHSLGVDPSELIKNIDKDT